MTLAGLLTFFGMAVVTMDVLGGVIAATFLARGMRPLHLLAFVGGYAAAVIAVTLALHTLLQLVGGWLAPLLGSETAIAVVQLVVGTALIGFALFQRHRAEHPPAPRERDTRDRVGSLAAGGLLLSLTTFADPTFTVAVGMAAMVPNLPERIGLLVAWNVIYQLPLVTVTIASLFGWHERVLAAASRFFGPRRRRIMLIFAGVLALAGLVVIGDGIVALSGPHHPWLHSLLLMRE